MVVCDGAASLTRWTELYHGVARDAQDQPLALNLTRPGALVGGLALDLGENDEHAPGAVVAGVELHVAGAGGQLPNLDLVNVVAQIMPTQTSLPLRLVRPGAGDALSGRPQPSPQRSCPCLARTHAPGSGSSA